MTASSRTPGRTNKSGGFPLRAASAAVSLAAMLLAGCAATPVQAGNDLARLHLFGADGTPRFNVYLTCAGDVSAETQLCWVPSKYFRRWADARRAPMKSLPDGSPFDSVVGVPPDQRSANVANAEYRVVIRFAPIAVASYTSEADGMGGYAPPKAGYRADVYVYSNAGDMLVAHADYHHKVDAPHHADAVPFVKLGVQAVLASLDPGYRIDTD